MKLNNVVAKIFLAGYFLFIVTFFVVLPARASVEPPSFEATLAEGESTMDPIQANLPGKIPSADIVFSLDLTGSMSIEISKVKQEISKIMDSLDAVIEDARYGVISYMDYPDYYCSYGYCGQYGHSRYGDYAYSLDTPLTYDRDLVKSQVNALSLGWGGDGPEDYARIFHEAVHDPKIGYSDTSRKILINFGDSEPHDDYVHESTIYSSYTYSWGGDPGRDEVMFTDDDIDFQNALNEMRDNNIILFHINSGWDSSWEYWAGITGGDSILLRQASQIPQVVLNLIEGLAEGVNLIDNLSLQIPEEYQKFIASVTPNEHFDLSAPDSVPFDIELTVPEGTEPGIYEFVVKAIGDGLSYGDHQITINVPATIVEDAPVEDGPIVSTFGKVTGGGFLLDKTETLKHSFGFNIHYDDKGHATMKGQLQFVDRNGNMNFHGNEVSSFEVTENQAVFTGAGRLNGEEGYSYRVEVVDNGNPGRGNDTFSIEITKVGSDSAMYEVSGTLAGGNIKVHEVKPKVKKAKTTAKKGKGKKK